MKSTEHSSGKPLRHLPNWLFYTIAIAAFIGFLDSSYLTVNHYSGAELNCSLTKGCGEVTTSEYSKIFGIPLALLGMLYYISVLITAFAYFDTKKKVLLKLLLPLTSAGILASAYFVYLQLFVIHAICQYCMLSAITSTLLFILAIISFKYSNK